MGFCTAEQHERFLASAPSSKNMRSRAGIMLIKVWLEVGPDEQERRFHARIDDPLRKRGSFPPWISSPSGAGTNIPAPGHDVKATDSKHAPWYVVRSDDKRRARLNIISHILSQISYKKAPRSKVKLPGRQKKAKV